MPNPTACKSAISPKCMKTFIDWDNTGICCVCVRQAADNTVEAARVKVQSSQTRENVIHWATLKVDSSKQESYGDRLNQSVYFHTDLSDVKEIANRIYHAIRAKMPFNPTCFTNQHSNVQIELRGNFGIARFETYHSIGD